MVALQLRYALREYIEISSLLNEEKEKLWAENLLTVLDENLQKHTWDGEWFMRGFRFDGLKFGSKEVPEGQIFLNPQTWAVISGAAKAWQAEKSMSMVKDKLATPYGIMICDPPYVNSDFNIVRAQLMNPGLKENAGIFNHTQGWAVIAESILGHGNQAYEYLRTYLPAAYNTKAEIREIEPYVVSQSTHARYSPKTGASRLPWLSGAATWTYYAITQYVLGIRPQYGGLIIDPCIPSEWSEFSIFRSFRSKEIEISVSNPNQSQKGVKKLILNGEPLTGNFIPVHLLKDNNQVTIEM